jgi:hypothetical protein
MRLKKRGGKYKSQKTLTAIVSHLFVLGNKFSINIFSEIVL